MIYDFIRLLFKCIVPKLGQENMGFVLSKFFEFQTSIFKINEIPSNIQR